MTLHIELAESSGSQYTNCDVLQGCVVLSLSASESISHVTVRLEGVARSTCYKEPGNGKTRSHVPIVEEHKFLYVQQVLFPGTSLRDTSNASSFTLAPGRHSWEFSLEFPINNACIDRTSKLPGLSSIVNGPHNGIPLQHVQQILPPSLIGTEEYWIRYYVKATVTRPSFFAINHRAYKAIAFLPIDAPRAEHSPSSESTFFVRRSQTLSAVRPSRKGFKNIFTSQTTQTGVNVNIELLTANPPSIIPGKPLLMEIRGHTEMHVKEGLTVTKLIAYVITRTELRAQHLKRVLTHREECYKQVLHIPFLCTSNNDTCSFAFSWSRDISPCIVPPDLAPSFTSCNIKRSYEIEIAITVLQRAANLLDIVTLTCPVNVMSGVIAPPPQFSNDAMQRVESNNAFGHTQINAHNENDELPSYQQVSTSRLRHWQRSGLRPSSGRQNENQHSTGVITGLTTTRGSEV